MFNRKGVHNKCTNDNQLLNKKSELISTCRHQNKLLLKCLKRNNKRHDNMDLKFNV